MVRRPKTVELVDKKLTTEEMRLAIKKLGRRITDLKNFDPQTKTDSYDADALALAKSLDDTLISIYGTNSTQYKRISYICTLDNSPLYFNRVTPLHETISALEEGKATAIAIINQTIKSLYEELEDYEETANNTAPAISAQAANDEGRKVFVVHGHDTDIKNSVARLLSQLDLEPIILHEQTDDGRTIIEKFNDHAGNVNFAVVLLTPDDIGGPKGIEEMSELASRARQNVILELGFFLGKLGRKKVCAIVRGKIETPSDYDGVIYKPFDDAGAWKFDLAKELRSAGLDIDMNKVA